VNPASKARIAGLAYLVIIFAATFAEKVVRDGATVAGDAAATATNILGGEQLWRWAAFADLITAACDVTVAILLYELLKPVSKTGSLLAAVFQLILVAIAAVKVLFHLAPLTFLKAGNAYLSSFTSEQLQGLSYLSLRLHAQAYDISLFFFGIHCLLIGWLIARAMFMPRWLGWALVLAGFCYISNTLARELTPEFARVLYPWLFVAGGLAETLLTLWLLVRGVNVEKWRAQAAAAAVRA
jgi:hypothetical protein